MQSLFTYRLVGCMDHRNPTSPFCLRIKVRSLRYIMDDFSSQDTRDCTRRRRDTDANLPEAHIPACRMSAALEEYISLHLTTHLSSCCPGGAFLRVNPPARVEHLAKHTRSFRKTSFADLTEPPINILLPLPTRGRNKAAERHISRTNVFQSLVRFNK